MLGLGLSIPEIAIRGRRGFSPASLFANGEQGAWYDPADLTTLYSDSAGTTPVTAVEQPVGLMLDKSRGLVLGSELFTTFDTIGLWTDIGGGSWSITNAASQTDLKTVTLGVTGRTYLVSVTIASVSGSVFVYPLNISPSGPYTTPGTYTFRAQANSGGIANQLWIRATTGTSAVVSSISVRELPGNHAFNPNATTVRPVLSARYNQFERTEQFDNAYWTKASGWAAFGSGSVADTTATTDPLGGNTADLLQENTATNSHNIARSVDFTAGVTYTASIYVKLTAGSTRWVWAYLPAARFGADQFATFDLSTGAVNVNLGSSATYSCVPLPNGWARISITGTCTSTGTTSNSFFGTVTASNGTASTYTGDGTSGIYIWGADLRVANESATIPYQRVVTATDYDADPTKFPYYVRFDGSDDWLQTANIDFSTVTSDGLPRRNLLTFPTAFDESAWSKSNSTISANAISAPDGATTADKLVEAATTARKTVIQAGAAAAGRTFSVYAKKGERSFIAVGNTNNGGLWSVSLFNLDTGTFVGAYEAGGQAKPTNNNIVAVGTDGWYRVSCTIASAENVAVIMVGNGGDPIFEGYTGDGASGIYIWGAQLETGSTATAFQNIGTDKMSVFAGVRKPVENNSGTIAELSVVSDSNAGSFFFRASAGGAANYQWNVRSATTNQSQTPGALAPDSSVLTLTTDLSTPITTARRNGSQTGTAAGPAGGGNFGNYPLYIGRRAGSSLPFNGRLYSLLVLGRTATADEITSAETYVAAKTGVVLL